MLTDEIYWTAKRKQKNIYFNSNQRMYFGFKLSVYKCSVLGTGLLLNSFYWNEWLPSCSIVFSSINPFGFEPSSSAKPLSHLLHCP